MTPIPAEPQRTGDPQAGYHALVNNGYIGCGMPYDVFTQYAGPAPAADRLPGRDGDNATLPWSFSAFTTTSGVEVVSANCLLCHAGHINGKLVVGLGATDIDFTADASGEADLAGNFVTDPMEHVEWAKWDDRMDTVGPNTKTLTVGVNPADNVASVLFAHRDAQTLAWSDTPMLDLPNQGAVVPVDVPPWWRMKKKNAMFYNAAGRGDHARIMMTASTLCTDSVEEAQKIDAFFPDIAAYVASITPPAWPFAVDAAKAAQGKSVFEDNCASCHGTYGADESYPNLLISLNLVGTDSMLSDAAQFADRFVAWFNSSFYGRIARLEPLSGYVAPPLDGIWATAPFLHNGSVPTLAALLDPALRPKYWTRTFDSTDYDQANVGWNFQTLDHGQSAEPTTAKRKLIYDTTQTGYGNGGHTFGATLSDGDRAALLEYLKTL
jgi:cytochrome c5